MRIALFLTCVLGSLNWGGTTAAAPAFSDRTFDSEVFGEPRTYRIFLPADYDTTAKRYPVIYYCHGHSDRYTLARYDDGKDTVPKIARFVANNDVIVVAVDGYVREHYEGFYGGYPWDVRKEGGDYDMGRYFQEVVAHIDGTYRTRPTRRFRAISGLSMGGFMSLCLSGRYPELLGSASAFNPGPEFYVGDKGRRVLWRPKDHVSSHGQTMVRLVCASGDYIRQFHEETRDAYARTEGVDFEYRQDEYHRHWATSIGETFAFHLRAFQEATLDTPPERWSYASAYHNFSPWDYTVRVQSEGKAIVYLTDVGADGLRVTTRRWAPDGPAVSSLAIHIETAPLYEPSTAYGLRDLNFATGKSTRQKVRSDAEGRLVISLDGAGHQLSILGPGVTPPSPVLLPVTTKDCLRLDPNIEQKIPLQVYNPGDHPLHNVRVELASKYPTVKWIQQTFKQPELAPGEVADAGGAIRLRLVAGAGYFALTRLDATLSASGVAPRRVPIDVLAVPDHLGAPLDYKILDGRTVTFRVFRQKGNQGGGGPIERTVTEGRGNGDGQLQPGEEATLWIKTSQGLDPHDQGNWSRAKIYTVSPWLTETQDLQETRQLEWHNARERTSVVRVSSKAPAGTRIPLLLDNETWSFQFAPDVRYGKEPLYQAFQRHQHHLHRLELRLP